MTADDRCPAGDPLLPFPGGAPATLGLVEALGRAAATDVRVTLYGEPGTGKSYAARWLHRASPRRHGRLARVSLRGPGAGGCLFDRAFLAGLVGGTLVLDGLDEAPAELQAHLVGVVEEWGVAEDGPEAPVRFLATCETDLVGAAAAGRFRRDLSFLLDVFPQVLPPLRERLEELPLWAEHFGRAQGAEELPPLPGEFLEEAGAYRWPGNLAELENLVGAGLPLAPGAPWRLPRCLPRQGGEAPILSFSEAKRDFELGYLRRVLTATGGNVTRAARVAGKARKDFYALMARNLADPDEFRGGAAS